MARPKVYTDQTQPYSLTIRLPRDVFDQMERYTGRHGRSRTEAIVEGLKLWLERQASSALLSHNNNNAVMHELTTPAHFLDDGIPFDDDHVPVPAPAPPAVAGIVHDNNNAVMQASAPKRRHAKVQPTVLQAAQNPVLAEELVPAMHEAEPKHRGRPPVLRPGILALLDEHPDGLTATELKVYLRTEKHIGDTLAGMTRDGLLVKLGKRPGLRYQRADVALAPSRP